MEPGAAPTWPFRQATQEQDAKQYARVEYEPRLSRGSEYVYMGPNAVVDGSVLVTCKSLRRIGDELFGPMTLSVTLSGRTRVEVVKGQGQYSQLHAAEATLFTVHQVIFQGPFRGKVGQSQSFKFSIRFPGQRQPEDAANYQPIPQFPGPYDYNFPPTMSLKASSGSCNIQYELRVKAVMPNMANVVLFSPSPTAVIRYQQCRTGRELDDPSPYSAKSAFKITSATLIPASERPSGLARWARANFSVDPFPSFQFQATGTIPRVARVGESLVLTVGVDEMQFSAHRKARATEPPLIRLKAVKIKLLTTMSMRLRTTKDHYVERGMERKFDRTEEIMLQCTFEKCVHRLACSNLESFGPFEEDHGWSKTVIADPIPLTVAPTFGTYNVSVKHSMQVTWELECAEEKRSFWARRDIVLLAPAAASENTTSTGHAATGISAALNGFVHPSHQASHGSGSVPPNVSDVIRATKVLTESDGEDEDAEVLPSYADATVQKSSLPTPRPPAWSAQSAEGHAGPSSAPEHDEGGHELEDGPS